MRDEKEMISGVEFTYYFICKRKLYLFANNLTFEQTNQDVRMGKVIEESYYKRSDKSKGVDDINLDKVDFKNEIVCEVKKSSKHREVDEWQCKYYIYYLQRHKGITLKKGILQYPEERLVVECYLEDEDIDQIESIICEIDIIKNGQLPPKIHQKICKKCAYYDFCYV